MASPARTAAEGTGVAAQDTGFNGASFKSDSSKNDVFLDPVDDHDQLSPFAAACPTSSHSGSAPSSAATTPNNSPVKPQRQRAATAAAAPAMRTKPAAQGTNQDQSGNNSGDDDDAAQADAGKGVSSGDGGVARGGSVLPPVPSQMPTSPTGRKKKLIPLRQVLRDSYEYHGLNELALFCITAVAVTLVLYWHWGTYTAIFKAGVQLSFQSYGNPDWQAQQMVNVETMNDAVEYSVGWMEFWLQRAQDLNWSNQTVRAGEYGEVIYARMLVNLDRNCESTWSPHLECYRNDELYPLLANGSLDPYGQAFNNTLNYSGWQQVNLPYVREGSLFGANGNFWWAYAVMAPKYNNASSTRDIFLGRLYNITRNSNLNTNNCDWLATSCLETNASNPNPCDNPSTNVPNSDWFKDPAMCNGTSFSDYVNGQPLDVLQPNGTVIKRRVVGTDLVRGQRHFVHNPLSDQPNEPNVLDLKPFLAKYAYSIVVDVLAANVMSERDSQFAKEPDRDRAVFSMAFQRSAVASEKPDRVMWQITSTVPVRTSFYTYSTDMTRIWFEALLYVCMVFVLASQVWQFRVCWIQFKSWKPFFAHYWNDFEVLSTIAILAWIIFYWGLVATLQWQNVDFDSWDMLDASVHRDIETVVNFAYMYNAWLYMGIVVDFIIFLRIARYMRIHVGLKAFYQVFIIAAREFLDFAVFLLFILVLLGSAVFAFFQLTGGNYQFLRFGDGLSVMTRLTFGFLSYEEFQSQALGVGAAVSAVTLLFWLAVILLVVYTQNIILAIVAEAYEEAKAKLGTAETSFLMLILMRLMFTFLYLAYRLRMFCVDMHRLFTGKKQLSPSANVRQMSGLASGAHLPDAPHDGDDGGGGGGGAAAQGPGNGTVRSIVCDTIQEDGDAGNGGQHGSSQPGSPFAPSSEGRYPLLQPTASVFGVLPQDVESQLRQSPSYVSYKYASEAKHRRSALRLFSSRQKHGAHVETPDAAQPSDVELAEGTLGKSAASSPSDAQQQQQQVARGFAPVPTFKERAEKHMSIGQRLRNLWYGLTTERHDVRMYKDLLIAPKRSDEGWIAAWKRRYWAPWCVARTKPVRSLMYLYQDFTSYKLKEQCTWEEAKAHGATIFKPKDDSSLGGPSGEGYFKGLPPLAEDSFIDEDTLSRIFLVSSRMAKDVNILFSPFKDLSVQSVGYLVRGISEVYGIDVDEQTPGFAGREAWTSYGALTQPSGSSSTSGSISTELKDATLGQTNRRQGGGGFISHLNRVRREGENVNLKQLALLGHAQRRLEEMAHKTERSLAAYRANQVQQGNITEIHIREQQQQTRELLKTVQALQSAVENLTHQGPAAPPPPAAATPSSGRANGAGAASAISAVAQMQQSARGWRRTAAASSGGSAPAASTGVAPSAPRKGSHFFPSFGHKTPAVAAAVDAAQAAVAAERAVSADDAASVAPPDGGRGDASAVDTEQEDAAVDIASARDFGRSTSAASRASAQSGTSASGASQPVAEVVMLQQLSAQMQDMMQLLQNRMQ